MQIGSDFWLLAADWFVNFSAGLFGAAVIVPAISEKPQTFNERLFLTNILLSLAFFLVAYIMTVYGTR
ncbi:MAG: hypothetical protein A3C02_01565 [Candidatus Andersenbacteria bacterium RIFCSPHIGHO2_02_FULL_45_11]|uniref:Uncharacterized protein n=1 Tax=Candidatus Andersenbacteria bacterium RIFCSPHIGHO2_12_FULL_45_11 TaxID=1797281 RepID=A0A1G1X426_9BACT|nr:MAG: hypothetical protein A2805_02285 [Candidatus Andersenbacteria bacterium RIFCSPHIGHO2_01_FULL_46_36]OGY32749.1 MAG: hypothetical protein A3C02_01565 [Candidatus Andersenbacteria bacterium RIFCSPHIGHO2_02_FULL_45_11]OGY34077.1 MAG: hypothetical protein A3D99_02380 [Candidatus Andersenbacteria bacterium RIFCSPHIGHO2_12_FULL_45_11]